MLWTISRVFRSRKRPAESRIVVADIDARQGRRGVPVLVVLLGSILLLGVYLAGMMIWAVVDTPMSPRDPVTTREPPVVPSSALHRNDPPAANPAYPAPAVPDGR